MKQPQTADEVIKAFEAGMFVRWHSWEWVDNMKILIAEIRENEQSLFAGGNNA